MVEESIEYWHEHNPQLYRIMICAEIKDHFGVIYEVRHIYEVGHYQGRQSDVADLMLPLPLFKEFCTDRWTAFTFYMAELLNSILCGTLIGVQQGLQIGVTSNASLTLNSAIFCSKLLLAIYMISVRPYVSMQWMADNCVRQSR